MSCIVARWKPCSANTWRAARTIRSRTACSCSWLTRGIDAPGEWLLPQAYSRDPGLARVDKTNAHSLSWRDFKFRLSRRGRPVRSAHLERARVMVFSRWGAFVYRFRKPIAVIAIVLAASSLLLASKTSGAL